MRLWAVGLALVLCGPALAESLRVASWDPGLTRKGPGLLLRDITKGEDQVAATVSVIAELSPDVLLLTGFDWDYENTALRAYADLLAQKGLDYPHLLALQPNRGMATGLDLDGDGRLGEADDAQGWGRFTGENGMALLSRVPLGPVQDYSAQLWRDQPGHLMGNVLPPEAQEVQRLSTTGHWDVTLQSDPPFHLLAFAATAPVFDGAEDRNGRRNHDEIAFWSRNLPDAPFVLAGNANLDPLDGEGRHEAITALLADPRLQDPAPRSIGGGEAADPDHAGDPALDTADWPDGAPGNLRVDYLLPAAELKIIDAGVFWPAQSDPMSETTQKASAHRLVWVDVQLP